MSDDRSDEDADEQAGLDRTRRTDASSTDDRDAVIASLERTLASERQRAAELLGTIDALNFKVDILEKSYAKQFEEARQRTAAAKQELATLATTHAETARTLTETRAELERVSADRNQLRRQLARTGAAVFVPRGDADGEDDEDSINELIADADWTPERPHPSDSNVDAKVSADPEIPSQELLSPDLVFTDDEEEPKRPHPAPNGRKG